MKASELIATLSALPPDTEIFFGSCCFPTTKWFYLDEEDNTLEGFRGSYTAGDPDQLPDQWWTRDEL